jgi:hypothetical protein
VCLVAVLLAVLFRLGWTRSVSIGARSMTALGSAALALAVVAWMVVEPMRPGWARKAGTPSTLLASPPSRASTATTVSFPVPFTSAVRGSVAETDSAGQARVVIDAALAGAGNAHLEVVIAGTPLAGGGVRMDRGTVDLGPVGAPNLYRGEVTRLDGTSIAATARNDAGDRISLHLALAIDDANNVGGTATAVLGGSSGN